MTPLLMASLEKLVAQLEREPANVRFSELLRVCVHFFGAPRQSGTSHAVFKVLAAIAKLQGKTR